MGRSLLTLFLLTNLGILAAPQQVVSYLNPVAIGTNTTLNCTIGSALSDANIVGYQWTKNGVFLSDGCLIAGSNQSTLHIFNVGRVDQGTYECIIRVCEVSNVSYAVNLTTVGPTFIASLNKVTNVVLNTGFLLHCAASSPSPILVLSWTFPPAANATGGLRIATNTTQVGMVYSDLIVTSVGSGGGGVYICAFTSRLPEDGINISTIVVILSPPKITGFPWDSNISATANIIRFSPYSLKCSLAPGLIPSLSLSLQRVLPNGTAVFLNNTPSTSVSFTLQSPVLSDTGVYLCIAISAIGNDNKTLNLIVQAPPDAVNILTITRTPISLALVRVSWSAPASNNAPITSYNITYCSTNPITLDSLCPAFGSETSAVVTVTSANIFPLQLNRVYRVSLVTINSVGRSPPMHYYMNTTTSDDATPVNFRTVLASIDAVIVTWTLSPLNIFTSDSSTVQLNNFTFCFSQACAGLAHGQCQVIPFDLKQYRMNPTLNTTVSLKGTGVAVSSAERCQLALNLTAYYLNPSGSSSTAVVTANITSVAGSNIQAVSSANPTTDTVTFSWDSHVPTPRRPFISHYLFMYSMSSLYTTGVWRCREPSCSPTSAVNTTYTSVILPLAPYSMYTYQVLAAYASGFTAPITDISSFNTSNYQTAAGPPQNFRVVDDSTFTTIPLEWSVPAAPNGAISSYILTVITLTSYVSITLPDTTLSYQVTGLKGYTKCDISVAASNGYGLGTSSQMIFTTPYAVCPPTLQLSAMTGTSFTVSIAISDLCGPLSFYRVIVGKDSNLPPSNPNYWSNQTQFNVERYYVLYTDDILASSNGNKTVTFEFSQIPTSVTYNNVIYSVVVPDPGSYYLMVLLYSSVDMAVFSSSLSVPFTVPEPPIDTEAIMIGALGSVAFILLVIFLILLVMAIMPARKGREHSRDASIKKENSQDLELTSINMTDNVCYGRVHVPECSVIYETIIDGNLSRKKPIPPLANETVVDVGAKAALYHNLPSSTLPSPPLNSTSLLSTVSSSPHHITSSSSRPSSFPVSTLPLPRDLTQPPLHLHTLPISATSFCDHVHSVHMKRGKHFESEHCQLSEDKPESNALTAVSLECHV